MAEKLKRSPKTTKKKTVDRTWLKIVLIVVWFLSGLYFGMAGWSKIYYDTLQDKAAEAQTKVDCNAPSQGVMYKGIQFCTIEDVQAFQHLEQMENARLTWGLILPDPFSMVFSAFAFGVVGSVLNIFRMIIDRKKVPDLHVTSTGPVLGGMTALLLLGFSFLLPSVFFATKIFLDPTVQPFLSLFAGAFSEHILKWLQTKLENVLKTQKESA